MVNTIGPLFVHLVTWWCFYIRPCVWREPLTKSICLDSLSGVVCQSLFSRDRKVWLNLGSTTNHSDSFLWQLQHIENVNEIAAQLNIQLHQVCTVITHADLEDTSIKTVIYSCSLFSHTLNFSKPMELIETPYYIILH